MAGVTGDKLARLVRDHHDAWLVDLLGVANCGLSPARVAELRRRGLFKYFAPEGQGVPGAPGEDVFSVTLQIADWFERASASGLGGDVFSAIHRQVEDLVKLVKQVEVRREREARPSEAVPGVTVLHEQAGRLPHAEAKEVPVPEDAAEHLGGPPLVPPREPPPSVADDPDPRRREWYGHAVERIGSFCRGLGNRWDEDLQEWFGEQWDGETPVRVPQPDARQAQVRRVRELVVHAWEGRQSTDGLARALARETGDFGRNWRRVAQTEIQALFNETVVRQAVERKGRRARMAYVPESTACKDCLRLFVGEDGQPIVFEAGELLRNGTNVGKPRPRWRASVWPVHSNCRCLLLSLPDGTAVDRRGHLVAVAIGRHVA